MIIVIIIIIRIVIIIIIIIILIIIIIIILHPCTGSEHDSCQAQVYKSATPAFCIKLPCKVLVQSCANCQAGSLLGMQLS